MTTALALRTKPPLLQSPAEVMDGSPAKHDALGELLARYKAVKARLQKLAEFVTNEVAGDMSYFVTGNCPPDRRIGIGSVFVLKGAVAALDSDYWNRAMQLTDVYDMMPQARRDTWNQAIEKHECPAFEDQTVRDTIADLLASRAKFLAERVDGIFRNLSGEHVTNTPQGFGKRMIIANVLHSVDMKNHSKTGYINDLRCVIAKFMKREEPRSHASLGLVRTLKGRWGEWVPVDGNALKIRLYKKGTAHLEVHPDMAWRLNTVLAQLYPKAIPAQFREKPRRRIKTVDLIQRPLPFAVVSVLAAMRPAYIFEKLDDCSWRDRAQKPVPNAMAFEGSARDIDKRVHEEAEQVLLSLGGVKTYYGWQFDYPPEQVLNGVVTLGCVPDDRAHQFYPTPARVAKAAVKRAHGEAHHAWLEPSAGIGGIADLLPKARTTCIEVSQTRVDVLLAKGHAAVCADFLEWSAVNVGMLFDRIVMNPPFDRGRWRAHLEAAAAMLKPEGRLVAVLPASAKNATGLLPKNYKLSFRKTYENAFAGASVTVVILVVTKR